MVMLAMRNVQAPTEATGCRPSPHDRRRYVSRAEIELHHLFQRLAEPGADAGAAFADVVGRPARVELHGEVVTGNEQGAGDGAPQVQIMSIRRAARGGVLRRVDLARQKLARFLAASP